LEDALKFEWDPNRSETNLRKHGVSFDEASSMFGDKLAMTIADPIEPEERQMIMGVSQQQRLLLVVHLKNSDTIRIISARKATAAERRKYEEGE
jgi:uncharacterized DUF497 family protein